MQGTLSLSLSLSLCSFPIMEEEREKAQASLLLTLFDRSWFYHQILLHDPPPLPPPFPPHLLPQDKEEVASSVTQPQPSVQRHRRSLSDELSPSEDLCINPPPPKLQTILSGKEGPMAEASGTEEEIAQRAERWRRRSEENLRKRRRRRRRRQASKSLSDLEFEELRGLMDLGFDFSDADADARLMSIVPALRRRSRTAEYGELAAEASSPASDEVEDAVISRPYLSEAWDAEEDDPLRNWRIPVAAAGVDIKDHLKLWAHAVASTIR